MKTTIDISNIKRLSLSRYSYESSEKLKKDLENKGLIKKNWKLERSVVNETANEPIFKKGWEFKEQIFKSGWKFERNYELKD
jgi:hypothetical protein